MGNGDELRPAWTLWIGRGNQADLLRGALAGMVTQSSGTRIESLARRTPSLPPPTPRGRVILEVETLEPEDLAEIEAFLGEATGWELVLLDRLGLPHLAQRLVGPAHIRWWPGSLTLEQTQNLLDAPRTRDTATLPHTFDESPGPMDGPGLDRFDPDRASEPYAPLHEQGATPWPHGGVTEYPDHLSVRDPLDAEMGAIRAILEGGLDPSTEGRDEWERTDPVQEGEESPAQSDNLHPLDVLTATQPAAETTLPNEEFFSLAQDLGQETDHVGSMGHLESALPRPATEGPAAFAPAEESPEFPKQAPAPTGTETKPPSWYRAQVADLNDYVQRLQLDLFALDDSHPTGPTSHGDSEAEEAATWQALREDVARLGQFARTLGFVAAPPATGGQRFSLPTLVQEQLTSLSFLGPEAPRFMFRTQVDANVRSDKALLVGALDALLQVAGHAAELGTEDSPSDGPATVRVECSADQGGVQTLIHFPPGPLTGWSPGEVFEPYRLKQELPEIGPNALRAARSIVRGQGGELSFHSTTLGDSVSFRLWLPMELD